ncbi:MAG: glycosyltransferase family 2 protein [Desulfobacterales bacterium]|nr:MAG: glycosyltransferase family 2 protein [Desulfobacterales bacterium]
MTKLIIQIPCYNEEKTLPLTLNDLPRRIPGVAAIETLIIDDGSTDETVEVARKAGVDHIIRNKCNKGLARSFLAGLDASLRLGADIIVNTDGDNQYQGQDIAKLIAPILRGDADIVIGDRQTGNMSHLSFTRKKLQRIGSFIVRLLSETNVPDAVSGFRAFSRDAAMQMNIVSPFSYTIETIIQAGKKHMAITSVPVGTNLQRRESRLFKSIPQFLERSATTMIRMYTMYQPLRVFFYIGCFFILGGLIPSIRFLIYYFLGQGGGHIQSLILAAIFFIVGFQILMIGLVADVISFNRRLIEDTLLKVKRIELDHLNSNRKK